jgi:hypothetical protein
MMQKQHDEIAKLVLIYCVAVINAIIGSQNPAESVAELNNAMTTS